MPKIGGLAAIFSEFFRGRSQLSLVIGIHRSRIEAVKGAQ
jgi:hypothetical protein